MKKISKKWLKMAEFYKRFAKQSTTPSKQDYELRFSNLMNYEQYLDSYSIINTFYYDFSESAAYEMYMFESTGSPQLYLTSETRNGYLIGKHWMDATIKMWKEDIKSGLLSIEELKEDFGDWFIEKMLK